MCHLHSRVIAGRYADRGEPAWSPAELYHRISRRRGKGRATLAVAHAVLVILCYRLRDQKPSTDLGADSFRSVGY